MRPSATSAPPRIGWRSARRSAPRASLLGGLLGRTRRSGIGWGLSLTLFLVPLGLAIATAVYHRASATESVVLRVTDRFSGEALLGAQVSLGGQALPGDEQGRFEVERGDEPISLTVRHDGYEAAVLSIDRDDGEQHEVALRPTTLEGRLTDKQTGGPIVGAVVSTVTDAGPGPGSAITGADGTYRLTDVPDGGRLRVEAGDHGTVEEPIGERTRLDLGLTLAVVTGEIRDDAGNPVPGALVSAAGGSPNTVTGVDGTYRLTGAAEVAELVVTAPGFVDQRVGVAADRRASVALQRQMIKAIYANFGTLVEPERFNRLLEIADQTEINAIVIDVKQDTIYYETQVPFFRDIPNMITPAYDPAELLATLDEHGIYSIARMVVFKDPYVAEARPDLSVRDEVTGDLWRDYEGIAWVNAFNEELWQANADLAAELATLGFDEVQYDYIRFPSDGDLTTADFGPDYSEAARRAAISGAVALGAEQTRAAGAKFAIDLFPIVALMGDDQGIGQTLQDLVPLADYVCLMAYPSHYAEGNIPGVAGHPNDSPAETVTYTLEAAERLVPGTKLKMRPWLQDFTYPLEGFSVYGPAEVRAQIDAAEAFGASGWMLWNAAGEFEVDALAPES